MEKSHPGFHFPDMIENKKDGDFPCFSSLENNKFYFPGEDFIQSAINTLTNEHFLIISGPPRTGKTWLASKIVFEYYKKTKSEDIWWFKVNQKFISEMADRAIDVLGTRKSLFIFDDCQNAFDEFQEFYSLYEDRKDIKFFFIIRSGDLGELNSISDCELKFNISKIDREKYARSIFDRFVGKNKVTDYVTLDENKVNHFIKKTCHNLSFFHYYLEQWDYKNKQELADVNILNVVTSMYTLDEIKTLLPVAALCQFEPLMVQKKFLFYLAEKKVKLNGLGNKEYPLEKIEEILKKRSLEKIEFNNEIYLRMPEINADLIMLYAQKNMFNVDTFSSEHFQDYLRFDDKQSSWVSLFRSLNISDINPIKKKLAEKILQDLVSRENWEFIVNSLRELKTQQLYMILNIIKELDKEKALKLWSNLTKSDEEKNISYISTLVLPQLILYLNSIYKLDRKYAQEILRTLSASMLQQKILGNNGKIQSRFFTIVYRIGKTQCKCGNEFWTTRKELVCRECKEKFTASDAEIKCRNLLQVLINDKKILEDYTKHIKENSASGVRQALSILTNHIDTNLFFNTFNEKDWTNIIDTSTLRSIRQLQNDLIRYDCDLACQALNNALIKADFSSLFAKGTLTLYRLNGIIGNLMQTNFRLADEFLRKISVMPLDSVILSKDITQEYNQVNILNNFLSHRLRNNDVVRKKIIQNISFETWFKLLDMASSEESFFLLWNLFIDTPNIAKALFSSRSIELVRKWEKENWSNDLLNFFSSQGLLILLGYHEKKSYSFDPADFDCIKASLQSANYFDFSNLTTKKEAKLLVYNDLQRYRFLGNGIPLNNLRFLNASKTKIQISDKRHKAIALLSVSEQWCYLSNDHKNIRVGIAEEKNANIIVIRINIIKTLLSLFFLKNVMQNKEYEEWKEKLLIPTFREALFDLIKNNEDVQRRTVYSNILNEL
jgi:hypothetical protein